MKMLSLATLTATLLFSLPTFAGWSLTAPSEGCLNPCGLYELSSVESGITVRLGTIQIACDASTDIYPSLYTHTVQWKKSFAGSSDFGAGYFLNELSFYPDDNGHCGAQIDDTSLMI